MITKIITHKRPHADELVARMLLRKFKEGEEKFPGISHAHTTYMATGELPDGKTSTDFPDTVFLGCGGGMFDEHATTKKERDTDECAATLVAKHLGLDNDKALEKILHFVKSEDLGGAKVKNELPKIIKYLHQASEDQESIAKWAEDAYFAEYNDEKKFLESIKDSPDIDALWKAHKKEWQRPSLQNIYELLKSEGYKDLSWWMKFAEDAIAFRERRFEDAKEEFRHKGKMETIEGPYGIPIKFATIESLNEEMNKYVRSIGGDVVLQFQNHGGCFITTRQQAKIDLSFVFVLLRMAEQHYRGGIKIKDEETLSKEGFVDGVPSWYLFHNRQMGFNGSLTASDVEPSKIPKEKIIALVKEGLSPKDIK